MCCEPSIMIQPHAGLTRLSCSLTAEKCLTDTPSVLCGTIPFQKHPFVLWLELPSPVPELSGHTINFSPVDYLGNKR